MKMKETDENGNEIISASGPLVGLYGRKSKNQPTRGEKIAV